MSKTARRSDLERRSRRTLLWCAFALCVSPLIGGYLVDHSPLHIRFPDAALILSRWEKADPSPNILVLGSSRLGSFIRTRELTATTQQLIGDDSAQLFNSALPVGDPITMEFMTRRLLALRADEPRLALVETDADLLGRDNVYFKFLVERQMTLADVSKYVIDIVHGHALSTLLASRLTPFFRHRNHLLAWAEEAVSNKLTLAKQDQSDERALDLYEPQKELHAAPERLGVGLRLFGKHLRHYQLEGGTSCSFESLIAMLHARGCDIVLVQTPLSSAQRTFFSAEMRKQFEVFIQRLQCTYGCEFVDYSDRLPDPLFYDIHHANENGRRTFTSLLATEVIVPAWQKLQAENTARHAATGYSGR